MTPKKKIKKYAVEISQTEINALVNEAYEKGRLDEAKSIYKMFSESGVNMFWLGARCMLLEGVLSLGLKRPIKDAGR